ncbi:MAG: hypothetical protein UU25_C0010G0002 [Microgenomates group bacterium GW2011_GWB1_40_9]|nr:MAG: hypothetical protein UT26_C0025G0013 [Microgenomates group bacterium GW2011_GWC1_39_12]KKR79650.1 MAG: hypothetical protein UU25_C0010G0002 [Microgenomates group bacterium GW2011_GWB1_40_9]
MKKQIHLTADDVRDIMDDKFRETGLDELPKRLKTLDKILMSVDKMAGDFQKYRDEQELHVGIHDRLNTRVTRLEKHARLIPLAD